MVVDLVTSLEDTLVDGIVVVKCDESEATRLVGDLVQNDFSLDNISKLLEIVGKHLLGMILADSAYVETFGRDVGLISILVILRHSSLRVDCLSINDVGTGNHGSIDHGLGGEGDESESARSLGVGIAHDDDVGDVTELRVEIAHRVVSRVGCESADENLAETLRLATISSGSLILVVVILSHGFLVLLMCL